MKWLAIAFLWFIALPAFAVSNDGKIPILAYHTWNKAGCGYGDNDIKALEADLETLFARGYTIVPLASVAVWVTGELDGSALPKKPVAISFDDGPNQDWYDSSACGYLPSVYSVLKRFKDRHPELPAYSPHATVFVIASPVARDSGLGFGDEWWWAAQNQSNGLIDVGNHSADHDAPWLTFPAWDPYLNTHLRIGSIADGNWSRPADFARIDTWGEADVEVYRAALFISGKTGVWPTLFAYPYGQASEYLKHNYFPNNYTLHRTYAAFCSVGQAATRESDRWCIPRFGHGDLYWKSPQDFLKNVLQEPEVPRMFVPRRPEGNLTR